MKQVLNKKRRTWRARGVIAVELALILPLLVWIIMGIVDLGLMGREHQVIQNATREGARFSSLPSSRIDPVLNPGFSENDIKAYVVNYASREGITIAAADVTVNQNHNILVGGITVRASRITASKSYQFITPGMSALLGSVSVAGEGIYRNLF